MKTRHLTAGGAGRPARATRAGLAASLILVLSGALAAGLGGCGSGRPSAPKILVIGMDGATFDLIGPWMDQGKLPNLKAIRDGGVWGNLLSVIPPLSPPAWTSAVTGVNPGQHGIYDFNRYAPDEGKAYTETAASRRVPAYWTLMSEAGLRVGTLNIPMTDPPDEVNGFQVAGLPHPDSVGYAYPPELEARLHREGYKLDRMGEALVEGHEADLEREIVSTLDRRKKVALELGADHPDLDVYWVVFTGTDRIQHFFWKFMEKDHPFYDPELAPRFGDSILHVYEKVDEAIGDLVAQARAQAADQGRELAVIVLSDHGFCGVHRAFRPQSLLHNPPAGEKPITNAYSMETNASMIYVPLVGRDKGATLSRSDHDAETKEIVRRVLAARDPENGECPVILGARKEDLFTGRYVDKAPDILFLARPGYYLINEEGDKTPFGTPKFSFSAHHEMHGVFFATGPMFGTGHLEGKQSLLNIAPTLMYLAGLKVPGYMEADVLTGALSPGYLKAHPVQRDESTARETGSDDVERIKALPYVQ